VIPYTEYERMSLREARATFRDPFRTPVSALVHIVEEDGARPLSLPWRGLGRLLGGALDAAVAMGIRTLDARAVVRHFRGEGVRVRGAHELLRLELWEIDEVTARLPRQYLAAGAALGLAAGSLGLAGVAIDVTLVVPLAARAIGDYALHYGFDPRGSEERRFARDVLVAALTPVRSVRAASIDDLAAAALAGTRAWRRREIGLGATLLRIAQRVFATGLSRGQRAAVARVGCVAAAAVNAWLLVGVMRAARSAYRQRFLARR
jgi:hypothetical protein